MAPQNRLGAKTPPEPPMPMVRLHVISLPTSSKQQERNRVLAGHRRPENRVADAVHLREHQQQPAEQDPHRLPGRSHSGPAPRPVAQILDGVQHPREPDPDKTGDQPEDGEQRGTARGGRPGRSAIAGTRYSPAGRGR